MNILAVASPSVSVLSLHHQIHQHHSRILSLSIKKVSFCKCWGYSTSICSSRKDVLQGQYFHSNTSPFWERGLQEEALQPALWEWLAFTPCIQTSECKKKNSTSSWEKNSSAFPPGWSTRSRTKKQITPYMNKEVSGPCYPSQRYSQFLIHSLLAQGLWPSQGAASKLGVDSLVWHLQRVIWGCKCTVRLLQMLIFRVLAMWPQFIQLLLHLEQAVYQLSYPWCHCELVACWDFIWREGNKLQNAAGPVFCVMLDLDFGCSVPFTTWIRGICSCTPPLLQALCSCLPRAVGRGGGGGEGWAAKLQQH